MAVFTEILNIIISLTPVCAQVHTFSSGQHLPQNNPQTLRRLNLGRDWEHARKIHKILPLVIWGKNLFLVSLGQASLTVYKVLDLILFIFVSSTSIFRYDLFHLLIFAVWVYRNVRGRQIILLYKKKYSVFLVSFNKLELVNHYVFQVLFWLWGIN